MFDHKTTKESWTFGIGAGAGLLLAGAGAFPALLGVSVTAACATSLRGMWDSFKRKNSATADKELSAEWRSTLDPFSDMGPLQKASSYNNFLDALKGSMKVEGPNVSKMQWANSLHSTIDSAIFKAERDGHGTDTLVHVKEQTRELLSLHIDNVANTTFVAAMDQPVTNDVVALMNTANKLEDAVLASQVQKTMGPVGNTQYKEQLHAERTSHLQRKLEVVSQTFYQGISMGGRAPEQVRDLATSIATSMGRMRAQLHPVVPTILSEEKTPQNKAKPGMSFFELQAAWSKTFLQPPENASATNVVAAYKTYHNKFVAFNEEHGPSVATLTMADLMHTRVKQALHTFGADDPMAENLKSLSEVAKVYLVENAAEVAEDEVAKLSNATTLDTYQTIKREAVRTRCAAQAQTIASEFAPQPEIDGARVERIEQQFSRLNAGMALGPNNSGDPMAVLDNEPNIAAAVDGEISQARYQMTQMRKAQASHEHVSTLGTEAPSF